MSKSFKLGPYDDFEPLLPDVVCQHSYGDFTGLFDEDENPIFRPKPPVGFGRDSEWPTKNSYLRLKF